MSVSEPCSLVAASPLPSERPPSAYADEMPRLHEFASLPESNPRRAWLREELIMAFLPVVEHVARRHSGGVAGSQEELVQVGTVALINAIDRWDPERARGEFLGYLIPCVRGEILRWFRDRTWSMRVSRRVKELTVEVQRAVGPLAHELGRAPRPSELAHRLGVGVDEVLEALDAKSNQHAGTLDAVDPETGTLLLDRLGSLDAELELVEYRHALKPLLQDLPERERRIVMMRFFGELTQTQIAARVGVSQMHVSRLLSRTLETLRRGLLDDPRAQEVDAAG